MIHKIPTRSKTLMISLVLRSSKTYKGALIPSPRAKTDTQKQNQKAQTDERQQTKSRQTRRQTAHNIMRSVKRQSWGAIALEHLKAAIGTCLRSLALPCGMHLPISLCKTGMMDHGRLVPLPDEAGNRFSSEHEICLMSIVHSPFDGIYVARMEYHCALILRF